MIADHFNGLEKFESGLWKIADNLRANSNLASNEYFMPIMGLIFLRHATNRFYEARAAIEADKAAGKMPDRPLVEADFTRRRALNLPESARFDVILKTPKDGNLGAALTSAMDAVETAFPPLAGQLPKDYGRFEGSVLEDMMKMFDSEGLRTASGDVFGRIYEYFLAEFSKQGAHDGGEFFTPPSIVQTIVNVIEPDHGIVFDPACGSGGMFVQSSHFIEDAGQDTMKRVTFYGHEKNETTAKLAQINLAVHGLQGTIRAGNEAITYYKDPHELVGKCDFVMANPPFNVDEVDAEKVKGDKRLPFGLPGVNKNKKVSNANYLWLSYFYSYLNETGRAGVVMSSQASSAGRDEATVRQKLVETGAVDVMIDIRGNFFYTRTVPCQLWFFDRAKEKDTARRDQVLMLDARSMFRKVSRSVYDFSPEQQKNIAAIVWLYRGQQDRFLKLVATYLAQAAELGEAAQKPLDVFGEALGKLADLIAPFAKVKRKDDPLAEPWDELTSVRAVLAADIEAFGAEAVGRPKSRPGAGRDNARLNSARVALHPLVDRCRDLTKQIDLAAKLAGRAIDISLKELDARNSEAWGNGDVNKARKALDEARANAVEALRQATSGELRLAGCGKLAFPGVRSQRGAGRRDAAGSFYSGRSPPAVYLHHSVLSIVFRRSRNRRRTLSHGSRAVVSAVKRLRHEFEALIEAARPYRVGEIRGVEKLIVQRSEGFDYLLCHINRLNRLRKVVPHNVFLQDTPPYEIQHRSARPNFMSHALLSLLSLEVDVRARLRPGGHISIV